MTTACSPTFRIRVADARLVPPAAVAVLAAIVLAGCGGGGGGSGTGGGGSSQMRIDWNLSQAHDMAAVQWPQNASDLDAAELKPVDSVRIALPGGRVFDAKDGVKAVFLHREGERVDEITINSAPMTTDQAYKLALAWTKEWNLDSRDIEAWYAKRTEQRKQGDEDKTSTAQAGNNKEFVGGSGGPNPSVELQYSFMDDKPSIVALDFFWPRPTGSGGTENGTPDT